MTPPITMSLMGGLGNQLFQLATGLEVAQRAGTTLALDLSWFQQSMRRSSDGLVLRPYELQGIADDIPKVDLPQGRVGELVQHVRDVAVRRGSRVVNRLPLLMRSESGADFDPEVLAVRPGTHLWGYFASWRYFPTVANEVRSRVLNSPRISDWAKNLMVRAREEGAIALHVRRGDYLALAGTYGHVSPQYYVRGLRLIRELGHQNCPVWLFSDDPEGARQFLRRAIQIDYVINPPPEASSLESMIVMSAAKALAIANSTYSWWAAFVGQNPQRPVIAPRPTWAHESMPEPRDSLLPTWITVDCRENLDQDRVPNQKASLESGRESHKH